MHPALTVKSQVTIPKEIREFLGIGPGERLRFDPLPDGRVAIAPLHPARKRRHGADAFSAMRGVARDTPGSTEDVMRMTRGSDWNAA